MTSAGRSLTWSAASDTAAASCPWFLASTGAARASESISSRRASPGMSALNVPATSVSRTLASPWPAPPASSAIPRAAATFCLSVPDTSRFASWATSGLSPSGTSALIDSSRTCGSSSDKAASSTAPLSRGEPGARDSWRMAVMRSVGSALVRAISFSRLTSSTGNSVSTSEGLIGTASITGARTGSSPPPPSSCSNAIVRRVRFSTTTRFAARPPTPSASRTR